MTTNEKFYDLKYTVEIQPRQNVIKNYISECIDNTEFNLLWYDHDELINFIFDDVWFEIDCKSRNNQIPTHEEVKELIENTVKLHLK